MQGALKTRKNYRICLPFPEFLQRVTECIQNLSWTWQIIFYLSYISISVIVTALLSRPIFEAQPSPCKEFKNDSAQLRHVQVRSERQGDQTIRANASGRLSP